MPMQRITRYGVLLKVNSRILRFWYWRFQELYENSANLPKERTALLAALDAMQKFENNMKNFQREAQEYAKLVDIKKSLEHISKVYFFSISTVSLKGILGVLIGNPKRSFVWRISCGVWCEGFATYSNISLFRYLYLFMFIFIFLS